MHTFTLDAELFLPRPLEEVFAFFSDAANLEVITPEFLSFKILTPQPVALNAGALIDYRIGLHGIPMTWKTRITVWEPPLRFVDEQLSGPYRKWVHTHTFTAEEGGTRCRDHVEYAVPGGPGIERLIERWVVRRDVQKIFAYRQQKLKELFGG